MGKLNVGAVSDPKQAMKFTRALLTDLKALEKMLAKGMFESSVQRIGAEQELCLVDQFWCPAPLIMEILKDINDLHFTTELAKFNLEINLDPLDFADRCFSTMENELNRLLGEVEKSARKFNAEHILTGILPTIRTIDVEMDNMTPAKRYKVLFNNLRRLHGGDFEYRIHGSDELIFRQRYPTFEFCNTAFQVHFQVDPERFADVYNFSKLITAPVLAAATNSPLLFGKRLWKETRIAVFQQAVDTRHISHHLRQNSARVSFSKQWIRNSILEIFQDDIARFRVLLSSEETEDSLEILARGEVPTLNALQVFNGTIYRWNRACYGVSNGKPHLRIENRVFPAGPSVIDEVANAAFWLGLMNGFPKEYEHLPDKIEFDDAINNFIKAARIGLEARFRWMKGQMIPAEELILKELLPIARSGLERANVHPDDIRKYLNIIEERVGERQTGADWILNSYSQLRKENSSEEALVAITAGIIYRQKKGIPVHQWSLAKMEDSGKWINKIWWIGQIMSTDLITVQERDLIDLVISIMKWKNIHHLPVENNYGKLVGLITANLLLKHIGTDLKSGNEHFCAGDVMIKNPICVEPATLTIDALKIMRTHQISCLPVVRSGRLVGILTEHDFVNISARLLEDLSAVPEESRQ